MSKEQEFIITIEKVLSDFEQSEINISTRNAKDILHIRGLLAEHDTYVVLHALILEYVNNDMSRKIFGFLPFVNDLKSNLLDVIKNPIFDPMRWIHEERRSRRNSSTSSLSSLCESVVDIDAYSHQTCESRFAELEKNIKQIKESNEYLQIQNSQLEKAMGLINKDYLHIKAELEKVNSLLIAAKTEIDRLNLIILQKDETITKLSAENEKLKSLTLPSKAADKQNTPVKKSILGFFN